MNPTGAPSFGSSPPGVGAPGTSSPKDQLNVPSLILMIGGLGGVLMNVYGLVQGAAMKGQVLASIERGPDAEKIRPIVEIVLQLLPLFSLTGMALCGLMAFGGLKMRNLQSWSLALAGCIVGCIPCCASYCCILTLVGGVWGLVVLNKPDVKAAFNQPA